MKVLCGCCEPAQATPLEVFNRPALTAIAYRIGTYGSFRQTMLDAIAAEPELAGLTTRESDDYAITILESWSTVADILTFYQERYANEAFLRCAQFRDSVARLAKLLDYRPRPGIAAQTWIAFQLDPLTALSVPIGQKVQSVPPAEALPQIFETTEAIAADARWNRLRVFGAPLTLNPLVLGRERATLDRLTGPALAKELAPGQSVVLFNDGSSIVPEEKEIAALNVVDDRIELRWTRPIQNATWSATSASFRFQRTFRVFGHNAPPTFMSPSKIDGRIAWDLVDTSDLVMAAGSSLDLDAAYDKLAVGKQLLIVPSSGPKQLVTIQSVEQVNATVGPLTASVTRLHIAPNHAGGDRRTLRVYELEGEPLAFWAGDYPSDLSGNRVYLPGVAISDDKLGMGVEVGRTIARDSFQSGAVFFPIEIEKGRTILIEDATTVHEPLLATLKAAPTIEPADAVAGEFCHLVFELEAASDLDHDGASVVLLGNVAAASHGETVADEVVGSGDKSASFLRLALTKGPLTFLPSPTPSGASSTLELRVDRVRWNEVPGLFGQPAGAPVFELLHTDAGGTLVQFGDGLMGAQPATGSGNIRATYRIGSGLAGRVPAQSLTTLLRKPTGLATATNPLAAEGGADAESIEDARENAPRTVRTFGRAVSLQDFEDLVTASGEVAKAQATWLWDGFEQAIHLTIAGQAGGQFSAEARRDLARNLDAARDPNHRLTVDNYTVVYIRLAAGIGIDASYDRDAVLAAVHAAVVSALDFDAQRLGQSIHLSDFYRLMQDVAGVVFVDIDLFHFKPPPNVLPFLYYLSRGATMANVQSHLRVFSARPQANHPGVTLPAELAAIEAPTQDISVVAREV